MPAGQIFWSDLEQALPLDGGACRTLPAPLSGPRMRDSSTHLDHLLACVARGDRVAFRTLYDETSARLYAAARKILRDTALAEDAVQEAYLRIWRNAHGFDPSRGVALAWMGRIVRNTALDRIPAERETATIEEIDIAVMPVEPADARVAACLKKLPAEQGRALILTYVYGLTNPELADHLGAPLGTVKSWVRRGAESLRVCLGSQK